MKRVLFVAMLGLSFVGSTALADDSPWWGHVDYRLITGIDYKYSHDTHPDDRWLPNGLVPGSAGITSVSEAHMIQFGLGHDFPLGKNWVAWTSLDLGVGLNTDRHQNANDSRPPEQGAFVFSWPVMVSDVGVGVGYDIGRVRIGGEVRTGGLLILSGWDRYSSLDTQSVDWQWMYGAGPKVSVRLFDKVRLEGRVLFGNVTSATVGVSVHF